MLTGTAGSGAKTAFDDITAANHHMKFQVVMETATSGTDGGSGHSCYLFYTLISRFDLAFGYNQNTDANGLDDFDQRDYIDGFWL